MSKAAEKFGREAGQRWRDHPLAMVRELFGVEPDAWQAIVLEAFPHKPLMAMTACKGPGKTTVLAWLAWNFLLTRPNPNIAATSINGDNLRDGLLKEMAKWYAKCPILQASFGITTTRIVAKVDPLNWWMSFRTWPKSGDSNSQADTLAGLHADFILFILDESGGIPDSVMVSAEAALSSCVEGHILQAGNPTNLEGPLYRAYRDREENGGRWFVMEITGDPDDPNRAPRVSIDWARNQIKAYGKDNPWVLVNVFGRFPQGSISSLISEDEVRAAMKRWYRPYEIGNVAKIMGVDVARQGLDASVIARRQGIQMLPMFRYRNVPDGLVGASITNRLWNEFGADACFIDATGGMGFTWLDGLKPLGKAAIPVAFNARPGMTERYVNKRAEMYFDFITWIKNGGALPPEESEGARELMEALIRTQYFHKGDKLQLEEKDQIKDRIGFSPDEADACALTFAEAVSISRTARGVANRTATAGGYNPFADLERIGDNRGSAINPHYDPFA